MKCLDRVLLKVVLRSSSGVSETFVIDKTVWSASQTRQSCLADLIMNVQFIDCCLPSHHITGQWASTRSDMFPDKFCEALSQLHADAPAHS